MALLFALVFFPAAAALEFSAVLSDGVVLQRDTQASVFGIAEPGEEISVSISDELETSVKAVADSSGFWKALLKPYSAGGDYSITAHSVETNSAITLRNVTFGDVWFCSGQSNMELNLHFTLSKNQTFLKTSAKKYDNIRIFHFDHNPQKQPVKHISVNQSVVVTPWTIASAALDSGALDAFSGACYYYGVALTDRMAGSIGGAIEAEVVPLGLIESAYGGTVIESWVEAAEQFACSNITCASNQSMHFTKDTAASCFASDVDQSVHEDPSIRYEDVDENKHAINEDWFRELQMRASAKSRQSSEISESAHLPHISLRKVQATGAGSNGYLYNGMVVPFASMAVKGWIWYQGENNLPYHAGNVLDAAGYACMLRTLIQTWRALWSVDKGTTDPNAGFGVVMLADSTDEGWGCNVPQMHWAQTGNMGVAPNAYLPGVFVATAHDLPDPWDDSCDKTDQLCCVDTGKPVDPSCGPHRDFLVQTSRYPGVTEPVTPSMGLTIHPRVKAIVGNRLAQASWSVVYGHSEVAHTGPVISGCRLTNTTDAAGDASRELTIKFNSTYLVGGDHVVVKNYNRTEEASVMWLKVNAQVPSDAYKNYLYVNRQPWWGDDHTWVNVNHRADLSDPEHRSVIVTIPSSIIGDVVAVNYGHASPKGSPQNGHEKICCGNRDFNLDPCSPESCPISSLRGGLPAMPFRAQIIDGKCKCFAPQVCDE